MQKNVSKVTRFLGYLIDGAVAYIPAFILGLVAGATGIGILSLVGLLLTIGYLLLRDALFGGQSIGKKVMKYKTINADGSSLAGNYKASIIRNVSLFIPLVDAVFVIIDKPRLGETWSNTKVETI